MSNNAFKFVLVMFLWMITFASITAFAFIGSSGIQPASPEDALEMLLWCAGINFACVAWLLTKVMKT